MAFHEDQTFSSIDDQISKESNDLLLSLPKGKALTSFPIVYYQEFWMPSRHLSSTITFQKCFQARDDDIILASHPKSGTTWLKALLFSIVNRTHYSTSNTPLLTCNPHELVPFVVDNDFFTEKKIDLESLPSPRILSTHLPYAALPESIKASNCKIVYICRNPLDLFVSHWKFYQNFKPEKRDHWTLDEYFDSFCMGKHAYGPFWVSMLGYWNMSLETPNKVLFIKYEDIKKDTNFHSKKLAEFVGYPFSVEEEKEGAIDNISKLCSLSVLQDLEVNKNGKFFKYVDNKDFFRKGEVGNWVNFLSPFMVERLDKCIKEKLNGSGLSFQVSP